MNRVFPKRMFGASDRSSLPKSTSESAPIRPKATPMVLFLVIGSLSSKADKISVQIGVIVTRTALLIGVESSRPLKKESIFMLAPNKLARAIFGQSARSIFSDFLKRDNPQNSKKAPTTRMKINPKGFM